MFLLTRSFYWYQGICPYDLYHCLNRPLSGAFVFHKHILFFFLNISIPFNSFAYNYLLSFLQLLDELGKELEELRKYKIDQELNQSPRPRNNSMADLPGRYQALNSEVNRLKEVSKLCTENALAFANKKCTLPTKKQPAEALGFPYFSYYNHL